jgi:hypothetical protein
MKQHKDSEFQSIHTTEKSHKTYGRNTIFMRYLHCEIYAVQIILP